MNAIAWIMVGIGSTPVAVPETITPPKLELGLEITWKGRFSEAILHPARSFRNYDVELRTLVLDEGEFGSDLALLTKVRYLPETKSAITESQPMVRLELLRVDPTGAVSVLPPEAMTQLAKDRKPMTPSLVPLQELPIREMGMFLALPKTKHKPGLSWDIAENGRPPRNWKIEGLELVRGARTIKIVGNQATADYDRVSVQKSQWRRGDVIWLSERHGYAAKVDRVIERREPDAGEISYRSKLTYEQSGYLKYRDRLLNDQREEILTAVKYSTQLESAIREGGRNSQDIFEQIIRGLQHHEQTHLTGEYLPYREAVLSVKRRAEAARKGNLPPSPVAFEPSAPSPLVVGKTFEDFGALDLVHNEPFRISRYRGKPVVLVYYQPTGKTTPAVLKAVEGLRGPDAKVATFGMVIGEEAVSLKQREEAGLRLTLIGANDVYKPHGVTGTPTFVILDGTGVVRHLEVGWTESTPRQLQSELDKWRK